MRILQAFLALESDFFREQGLDSVQALDAVRQRYRAFAAWQGPTFDPDRPLEESPTTKPT